MVIGSSAPAITDTIPAQLSRIRDTLPPSPRVWQGAGTFEVRINTEAVIARFLPGSDSGEIIPEVAGEAIVDRQTGVVEIPISINNYGQLRFFGPVGVEILPSGISVLDGPRKAAAGVAFADAQANDWSVPFDSALPARTRWAPVERYLPARGFSTTLAIHLRIPAGVRAMRIRVRVTGRQIYTIGPEPPARFADSVLAWESATIYTHGEFDRSHVTRNALFLRYKRDISMEDRQAALDEVDGVVVAGAMGEYFVRIPEAVDSGVAPLFNAIRTLNGLTQVQGATIDLRICLHPIPLIGPQTLVWFLTGGK